MTSFSGAGQGVSRRRRDSQLPVHLCLLFIAMFFSYFLLCVSPFIKLLVGRRQSSLGDSSFNGGGKFSLGYECILGLSADIGSHLPFFWAWPTKLMIFGGFTDICDLYALPYIYFMKKLLVGSPSHVPCSISFPYLLSMKEEDFSASTSGKCFSFYTVLLSYVAVCTGPEDASETTSVYLVGENWVSTSLLTNFQLSGFVVKLLSTHSSFALNLLSSSHEDISILASFAYVVYDYN
ncbi:BnaC06g29880D [Brassica napus]|uniref:(rape) hypothetical protein n=1 Tax=Brassica napus TaxID=3708 RepID=A0A078H7V7_BRANA|nr:unnamed protein product [Brassica napus]CDY33564.1 BnaC06g29880D [Brassica napus]